MANKTVTVIEPISSKVIYETGMPNSPKTKVAAYARVSTEQDEQLSSYEAQVKYYTNFINNNPKRALAGIYSDEGIAGTNTKKRDGFNAMIVDAKAGKIDLILTKSISRFARNTVDTLQTVRELSALGIEVIFEKEDIHTMDEQCEVLLTIMSSLAQEESRSISENVRWGQQRRMQEVKFVIAYKYFLGYEKGEDGRPRIVPKEAKVVREIYEMFLSGYTLRNIADHLTKKGIPTPRGKSVWNVSTIESILTNEKYKGDALLQKTYTVDYLSKTVRKNEGEMKQYYVKNSHPAIIDEETFELVQREFEKRRHGHGKRNTSPFCKLLVCGECGAYYGHKIQNSKSKSGKQDVWYCNDKYKGETVCDTPVIAEKVVEELCLKAINKLLADKDAVLAQCRQQLKELKDDEKFEKRLQEASQAVLECTENLRSLIHENARVSQDQNEYLKKFSELSERRKAAQAEVARLEDEQSEQVATRETLRRFISAIEACKAAPLQSIPNEHLSSLIKQAVVLEDRTVEFEFMNSQKIKLSLEW